jgi:hypothetical protein
MVSYGATARSIQEWGQAGAARGRVANMALDLGRAIF